MDIKTKKQQVRTLCVKFGDGSPQCKAAFDELHIMRLSVMAGNYRKERGLPPNAKTPYC